MFQSIHQIGGELLSWSSWASVLDAAGTPGVNGENIMDDNLKSYQPIPILLELP